MRLLTVAASVCCSLPPSAPTNPPKKPPTQHRQSGGADLAVHPAFVTSYMAKLQPVLAVAVSKH